MRTLRPAEQARLVRRDKTLRTAFRRLRVSSASAAGTSMKIRGIVKNLRTRIRTEGGVKFRTRAGGKEYLLKETVRSRKGKEGVKGLSRKAVQEVVVEAEKKREELSGKGEKAARIARRRKRDDADERRKKRMAEIRMTREGRSDRRRQALEDVDDPKHGASSLDDHEKEGGTVGAYEKSPESSVVEGLGGVASVTNPEELTTQTSVADIAHEASSPAQEEPTGDAFTPVEDTALDMPGMDAGEGSNSDETEA